jgi:ATP-dependent protease ClpP protease subunit
MTVLVNGELVLYGFVGETFWDEGFTAREVVEALAEHGRDADITVRINSGGGYVDDGIAIYNALSNHKGKVTVVIDSLAASSASVIAMAGKERIMRKGATIMIHDPSSVVWGTADDMEKAVRMLDKQAANIAGIYADVTGEDEADLRIDMKAETWITADEAIERGFATATTDKKAKAAAAYDYTTYAQAPERLVALTGKKSWRHAGPQSRSRASASANAPNPQQEKPVMTEKTEADTRSAEIATATAEARSKAAAETRDRIKAIMTADDAKGRDALASHFAYETEMSAEAAIAALKLAPQANASTPTLVGGQYEQRRLAASQLVQPAGGKPEQTTNKNVLADAVARTNKRR